MFCRCCCPPESTAAGGFAHQRVRKNGVAGMKHYLVLAVGVAVLIGGCGKNEDRKPAAPQPSLMQSSPSPPMMQLGDPMPATELSPRLPAPDVSKGTVPELPKPGQANDHSSPEFKGGGQSDKIPARARGRGATPAVALQCHVYF